MTCMYWMGKREGCDAPLIPNDNEGGKRTPCPCLVGENGCRYDGEPPEEEEA